MLRAHPVEVIPSALVGCRDSLGVLDQTHLAKNHGSKFGVACHVVKHQTDQGTPEWKPHISTSWASSWCTVFKGLVSLLTHAFPVADTLGGWSLLFFLQRSRSARVRRGICVAGHHEDVGQISLGVQGEGVNGLGFLLLNSIIAGFCNCGRPW